MTRNLWMLSIAALLALGVGVALNAFAQASVKPPATSVATAPVRSVQRSGNWLSIEFSGGSVMEYFEALRDANPRSSYVMHPDLARVRMPPVKLARIAEPEAASFVEDLVHGVHVSMNVTHEKQPDQQADYYLSLCTVSMDLAVVADWLLQTEARIDLDFPGGTVAQFIAAVRALAPESNIVISPAEVGESELAPIKLTRVQVHDALKTLENVQWPDGVSRLSTAQQGEVTIIGWREPKPQGGPATPMSSVWSLREMIDAGMKVEDVLSAVEAVIALQKEPVEVKYHKETALLLVRGTPEQIGAILQVIDRLRDEARRPRPASDNKPK